MAAPIGSHLLLSKQVTFPRAVSLAAGAALASLALTVAVDSLMWRRLVWPEGEVFAFNTWHNKCARFGRGVCCRDQAWVWTGGHRIWHQCPASSYLTPLAFLLPSSTLLHRSSEWGTQSWHWYCTSALPRALHGGFPLAALGATWDRRARPLLAVGLAFVGLYSFLPHKEVGRGKGGGGILGACMALPCSLGGCILGFLSLASPARTHTQPLPLPLPHAQARFLFPALPLFTACAAVALQRILHNARHAKHGWRLAAAGTLGTFLAGAGVTALTTAVSRANYPGGVAIRRLHELGGGSKGAGPHPTRVHVGTLAAMTGVSRFTELPGGAWMYSKVDMQEGDLMACMGHSEGNEMEVHVGGGDINSQTIAHPDTRLMTLTNTIPRRRDCLLRRWQGEGTTTS